MWYLVLGAALGLALLWSGARGGGRFFRWVAPIWMTLLLARAVHFALTSPDGFVLLRFGEPHGAADVAGVLITIGQWLAVPWAFGASGAPPPKA